MASEASDSVHSYRNGTGIRLNLPRRSNGPFMRHHQRRLATQQKGRDGVLGPIPGKAQTQLRTEAAVQNPC